MKILVIQLAKMGDLLQTEFLLQKLQKKYPQVEITLLHSDVFSAVTKFLSSQQSISVNLDKLAQQKGNGFILQENDYTNEIIQTLDKLKFQLLINLNSNQMSASLLNKIPADQKIGFGSSDKYSQEWLGFVWSFIKSRRLNTVNLVDIFHNLLNFTTEFKYQKQNSSKPQIVFQLGSRNPKRQLPISTFVSLAKAYLANGKKIILTGVQSENDLTQQFLQHFPAAKMIENKVGKTNLIELKEILATSEKLITTDTGTMHLAALLNLPTSVFFIGPAYFAETSAYNPNLKVFLPNLQKFTCYPCEDQTECPYDLACHHDFRIEKSEEISNISYSPKYDFLGQIILPNQETVITKEIYFSFLYRIFAQDYFLDKTQNVDFYLQNYDVNYQELNSWKNELKRELKLWNFMKKDIARLRSSISNFNLLKPLVYLKLMNYENIELIDHLVKYFENY